MAISLRNNEQMSNWLGGWLSTLHLKNAWEIWIMNQLSGDDPYRKTLFFAIERGNLLKHSNDNHGSFREIRVFGFHLSFQVNLNFNMTSC